MLTVRRAEPADRLRAASVAERAYAPLREIYVPTAEAIEQKRLTADAYERLVGLWAGTVVATVEFKAMSGGLHLRALAVDPAFQRRGIARALVDELSGVARAGGLPILSLLTIRETGNVDRFERLGFRVVSEERASWCRGPRLETLQEVLMELGVSASASP
jgi:ribosomal protein S18 acetylase RimI-like enzyme